jgi:hypothetical protein
VNAETVDDRLGRFILSDYFDIFTHISVNSQQSPFFGIPL